MSAVRMCDRCGRVFSEREDGWSSFQGTRNERGESGRVRQVTENIDHCSTCSSTAIVKPHTDHVATGADAERLGLTMTSATIDA